MSHLAFTPGVVHTLAGFLLCLGVAFALYAWGYLDGRRSWDTRLYARGYADGLARQYRPRVTVTDVDLGPTRLTTTEEAGE